MENIVPWREISSAVLITLPDSAITWPGGGVTPNAKRTSGMSIIINTTALEKHTASFQMLNPRIPVSLNPL
jgi:hypothetical protein